MKFALKLSDDRFVELTIREIGESEADALPEERVFDAEEEAPSGRRFRRALPLAIVGIGVIALARRLRSSGESGEIDVDVEPESIEVEA